MALFMSGGLCRVGAAVSAQSRMGYDQRSGGAAKERRIRRARKGEDSGCAICMRKDRAERRRWLGTSVAKRTVCGAGADGRTRLAGRVRAR